MVQPDRLCGRGTGSGSPYDSRSITVIRRTEEEGARNLVQAVRRASVQCYAIEGRYPPSVEYLEENYGIAIDRERYHVFYEGFASNIMPDITVFPVSELEEQGE